jgi:hypothetical protein
VESTVGAAGVPEFTVLAANVSVKTCDCARDKGASAKETTRDDAVRKARDGVMKRGDGSAE